MKSRSQRSSSCLLSWLWIAVFMLAPLVRAAADQSVLRPANEQVTLRNAQLISSNRVYKFSFDGTIGNTYPVEVSTNMQTWQLLTNAAGAATVSIEDQVADDSPQRFYHVGVTPKPVPNMVYISPGSFVMGSPTTENGRDASEGPQTLVTISRGFWMAKFEVSQMEYIATMGSNYSLFVSDLRLPVDFVNWIMATNYCYNLTQKETAAGHLPPGYRYRLPTEAEWEYACRAGTATPVALGSGLSLSSTQANFDGGFPYGGSAFGPFLNTTSLPGSYAPNAWGLYDMEGNVWEWCQDFYAPYSGGSATDPTGPASGTSHVMRGGCFDSVGKACRSAKRDSRSQGFSNFGQGFRVVLSQ